MFIGHLALGFAAKRAAPTVSLAMLLVASQLADIIWPVLIAVGLEHVRVDPTASPFLRLEFIDYPYSHSLVLLAVWGVALGYVCRQFMPGARVVAVIAALVVSHWLLDVATHRPDMPIYPGGAKVGLGLWYSVPATVVVEMFLYAAGLWIYLHTTRALDAIGRWAFVSLAVFLPVAYVASIGSAPPSLSALSLSALVGAGVLTLWSWWADTHRDARMSCDRGNPQTGAREP